jgi:hypothetical protein
MLFAVSGKGDVIKLIETDPIRQPEAIYAIFTYYYSWWWQHWKALGFTGYNFFAPRLIASSGVPILTFLYFIFRYREKISNFRLVEKPESVHGDAHWATEREIRKVGLRAKKGMLMGQNKKGYLVTDGYQHALLFAPTGSGNMTDPWSGIDVGTCVGQFCCSDGQTYDVELNQCIGTSNVTTSTTESFVTESMVNNALTKKQSGKFNHDVNIGNIQAPLSNSFINK